MIVSNINIFKSFPFILDNSRKYFKKNIAIVKVQGCPMHGELALYDHTPAQEPLPRE